MGLQIRTARIRIDFESSIRIHIKVKVQTLWRLPIEPLGPWTLTMEAWSLKMKSWRVYGPVVADPQQFDEEEDSVRIRLKSWIRIRIKMMLIPNPKVPVSI